MKKITAFILVLSTCVLYFTACGEVKEGNVSGDVSFSSEESCDISSCGEETTSEETTAEETTSVETEDAGYKPTSKEDTVMPIPDDFGYDPIDAYFDNSVFIGYSIMMHFGRYTEDWRETIDSRIMGTAEFRAGVGMNFRNNDIQKPSDEDNKLPKHNNLAYNFEDLPEAMGVKTMVIGLMPYSDMGLGSAQSCARKGADIEIKGLKKIKLLNPELHIIVLSGTYNTGVTKEGSIKLDRMYNENIRTFNNYILEYCNSAGIDFIDVSTPITNGYGVFPKNWASDGVYHIKQEPYKIWIQVLRDYAKKKEAGVWQNPSVMPELGFEVE